MERVDVAIVGGGPAGTAAAHAAASNGADAVVFEKGVPRADRERLGPDSTDAAGILDYWVDIMDIHPDEFDDGIVLQTLDRAEFVGPNESVTLRSTGIDASYEHFGYTFFRAGFDDWMRERAEDAGAEYRIKASVKGVETDLDATGDDPRHTLTIGAGDLIGADYLILADGPQRTVTNRVLDTFLPDGQKASERLASPKANHIAYQEYRRFPKEVFEEVQHAIKFWWGVMPGHTAYPWVFPNDNHVCRVGLTMPIGLDIDAIEDRGEYALLHPEDERIPQGKTYIRRLLEWQYGDEYDIDTDFPLVEDRGKRNGTETYPISSTQPIESPVDAGIAVTGGAMGATSAFHEGGDHVAVRTGAIAGELAADGDLSTYNDKWRDAIGDEVLRNVTFADLVRGYGPADWDKTFKMTNDMLGDGGLGSLNKKVTAGLSGMKVLYKYKKRKRSFRKKDYVQLTADEYVY
ncbi:NAD(P)/FAD-dependent oxidoreductase [Natronocalculus amylovorans]|uniref:NAD(P)/FAD-dependent oxidoreductase n=1 Tax=Natronocalculus amylovorans TaxID=2917812 RepID=A0AAE3FW25_9EURY|nr:NAD(P)/FAD-dependent oxidoreductase [Natronocalculus amylovorans]MCL9816210.1 NAD(P)/FAD-dependent oxidoreductase [Natronocalculus amylovorans]